MAKKITPKNSNQDGKITDQSLNSDNQNSTLNQISASTQPIPFGLYWEGKNTNPEFPKLPFQSLEKIEVINESKADRDRDEGTFLRNDPDEKDTSWRNKIIWGDNVHVMNALVEQFAGKIDLIYIDPPFATGADFKTTTQIGGGVHSEDVDGEDIEGIEYEEDLTKEASLIEEVAYRDTWGKGMNSFLQMIYERLILMKQLLSEKGSIYVHVDYRTSAYVRLMMDEIFGEENFRNEIIWAYRSGGVSKSFSLARKHDDILFYSKTTQFRTNTLYERQYLNKPFMGSKVDGNGRYYVDTILRDVLEGEINIIENEQVTSHNLRPVLNLSSERTGYPTQKPEGLLSVLLKIASNEGDLVADFFCGSGTTAAVAERLNRRWITSDIGRFSINTARKRLLDINNCKPFELLNIGNYQRQYWQTQYFSSTTSTTLLKNYYEFILDLYGAKPKIGDQWIHGVKDDECIHVGAVKAPITSLDIDQILAEAKIIKAKKVTILAWEYEMGVINSTTRRQAKLLIIPREIIDPRNHSSIKFFDAGYVTFKIQHSIHSKKECRIHLTSFLTSNVLQIPGKTHSYSWHDYVDYWSIDWNYQGVFYNQWQTYRTRRNRKLDLTSSYYQYKKPGTYQIMVKVVDIFGNDTTAVETITIP